MRLKKGFTLAEILVVLVTIGIIATMTIPSMMKGVQDSQYKTAYKKAYSTISNVAALEKVAGNWISTTSATDLDNVYRALANQLSIKSFYVTEGEGDDATSKHESCVTLSNSDKKIGYYEGNATCSKISATNRPWIITEDNIAYQVNTLSGNTCSSKQAISAQANDTDATKKSCFVIVADVDGLTKGSNIMEPQGYTVKVGDEAAVDDANALAENDASKVLTGDRYKIYLGNDGASAGPRLTTITGRITSDEK